MSRTLNRVQLIGRLGGDPQMKYTTSGVPVTTFSLATNRQWQGRDGESREETDWHPIVAWDKLAQICSEHLTKGRLVYIEGRMQTRSWEQDGQTRYKTEVITTDMLILDSKGSNMPDAEPEPVEETVPQRSAARTNNLAAPAGSASRSSSGGRNTRPTPLRIEEEDPDELPF